MRLAEISYLAVILKLNYYYYYYFELESNDKLSCLNNDFGEMSSE